MALTIGDNFSFRARKPLDARILVTSIANLLAIPNSTIYDGIIVYVASDKKFYTYDSNNTIDPTLQQWRELKTASYTIKTATIDNVSTSPTYNHLILTLDDDPTNPTKIDCGNAAGPKGDKGDGFAITKLYTSISDMTSDASPVNDGQMVAVINTTTNPITAKVYIRNSTQTQDASGNENGYTFFCNLADATVIQGPAGPRGSRGYTPTVAVSAVAATSTKPKGNKVTITFGPGIEIEDINSGSTSFTTVFQDVTPSSISIVVGSDTYTDDGSGNIKNGSITVGAINYTTGQITFTTALSNSASITYSYKNNTSFTVYDGVSIKTATIRSSDSHLILTLTDGTTVDAGVVSGGSGGGGTSSGGTTYDSKLLAANWNSGTNQQTVTFTGYSDSYNGVIGVPSTATDVERKEYANCIISVVSQSGDQVTLQAENIPTIDIPIAIYCGGGSGSTSGGHTILDAIGTALAQEDDLQFKGLKVTDDATNKRTIVEPETLANDDIDDIVSAVPNVTRPSENYTTEEQLIGKWIDGSDLYRRIYTYTPNGSNTWYTPNIGLTLASINAKEITKMYGICKNPTSPITLTIPYNDTSNHVWIQFNSAGDYYVNTTLPWDHTLIIEYTKN